MSLHKICENWERKSAIYFWTMSEKKEVFLLNCSCSFTSHYSTFLLKSSSHLWNEYFQLVLFPQFSQINLIFFSWYFTTFCPQIFWHKCDIASCFFWSLSYLNIILIGITSCSLQPRPTKFLLSTNRIISCFLNLNAEKNFFCWIFSWLKSKIFKEFTLAVSKGCAKDTHTHVLDFTFVILPFAGQWYRSHFR